MKHKYRINIIWSDEDDCYLVELPEFAHELQRYFTHGETYEESIANAKEVLELLIEDYEATGKTLTISDNSTNSIAIVTTAHQSSKDVSVDGKT